MTMPNPGSSLEARLAHAHVRASAQQAAVDKLRPCEDSCLQGLRVRATGCLSLCSAARAFGSAVVTCSLSVLKTNARKRDLTEAAVFWLVARASHGSTES